VNVYIYQAALLCAPCGEAVREDITNAGHAPADPEAESTYDSDNFPKGPYPDGGGEADTPQHCDHCGEFLRNPLTGDGYDYVREQVEQYVRPDEDGEIDVEEAAARAQESWDATKGFTSQAEEDRDAPAAQWLRFYPEAWDSRNGYTG